jgi:hypothetical protein
MDEARGGAGTLADESARGGHDPFNTRSLNRPPNRPPNRPAQLLRGAGCTVNDLWDKDIDRQVGRSGV